MRKNGAMYNKKKISDLDFGRFNLSPSIILFSHFSVPFLTFSFSHFYSLVYSHKILLLSCACYMDKDTSSRQERNSPVFTRIAMWRERVLEMITE